MIDLTDILKALQYMRNHGYWSCDLFIKQEVLDALMAQEMLKQIEREEKSRKELKELGIIEAEYNRLLLSGSPIASIYGCPVYDMPPNTDNNADAVVCASHRGAYVIVGKEEELGIFQGWLVP